MQVPAPMLTSTISAPVLPPGAVAEPKWDGFRALIGRPEAGPVIVRSRHGTDLSEAFPELAAAAAALPADLGDVLVDGEIVMWHEGRLAFELLLTRLNRRRATAERLAAAQPAHFVAFDLLTLGNSLIEQPYRARRAALEQLFHEQGLGAPWTLCPASSDPAVIREWLTAWTAVGIEGICIKTPAQRYLPGKRGWKKYRVRASAEAVIGAVTGSLARPGSLLLGRYDTAGRLRYVGRTTPLQPPAAVALGALLTPSQDEHPWRDLRFKAAWGAAADLTATLVTPEVIAEVDADVSRDAAGRFRHPVRYRRARPDLEVADLPADGGAMR